MNLLTLLPHFGHLIRYFKSSPEKRPQKIHADVRDKRTFMPSEEAKIIFFHAQESGKIICCAFTCEKVHKLTLMMLKIWRSNFWSQCHTRKSGKTHFHVIKSWQFSRDGFVKGRSFIGVEHRVNCLTRSQAQGITTLIKIQMPYIWWIAPLKTVDKQTPKLTNLSTRSVLKMMG